MYPDYWTDVHEVNGCTVFRSAQNLYWYVDPPKGAHRWFSKSESFRLYFATRGEADHAAATEPTEVCPFIG